MYIIKIFSDFCSSDECKYNYERIYNAFSIEYYGPNNKIYFTKEDNYTHAIIINLAMPNDLKVPKKNIIGLAFEPIEFLGLTKEFIEYAQKNIYKYFIGSKHQLPEPFIEGFSFLWYDDPKKEIGLKSKKKIMSIIVSEKKLAPGHKNRHILVEKIIERRLPIYIYGRGSESYKKYTNFVKGEFISNEPFEEYLFSICIENFINNDYFSEKIINPILNNCLPIYLGCKNITNYFNEKSVLLLTANLDKDIQYIEEILKNPMKYYQYTRTNENFKKINLIENIENIFS